LDENDDAALEFDDVDQVDEEPDAPGDEAGNMHAKNVGDSGGAANDGHIALVKIFEPGKLAADEARFDEFAYVAASLDGDLGDAGERIAVCVVGEGQVTEDENLGMIGKGEIGIHFEAAIVIGFRVETLGDFAGKGSRGDATSPKDGA